MRSRCIDRIVATLGECRVYDLPGAKIKIEGIGLGVAKNAVGDAEIRAHEIDEVVTIPIARKGAVAEVDGGFVECARPGEAPARGVRVRH